MPAHTRFAVPAFATRAAHTVRASVGLGLLLAGFAASAQLSPVGTWRSFDDEGKPKAQAHIVLQGEGANQVLVGTVDKLLRAGVDPKVICDHCPGARKGKPVVGMELFRLGTAKENGVWEGGKILDPENGKEYGLRLTPVEGGAKLQVRGYVGVPMFGRSQTWVREE